MASETWGSRPSHFMIIPNTKRHPSNTKTDQLPILGVITGLSSAHHNICLNFTATCSVAMLVLQKLMFLWRSTKDVNVLCPTIYSRRCNRKQHGRRRGGRSVQLPDSFMILHSSSRHLCTYTYVLYVRPIFSGQRRKPPRRSGLGMDM